jgi:hypothetical protein
MAFKFSPGIDTIQSGGGAVEALFAARGAKFKAKGNRLEAKNYDEAAAFSEKNALYEKMATEVKLTQLDRDIYRATGGTEADVAGAGFAASGSALDILADSAQQGALTRAVTLEQGLITEEGYKQQAKSYRTMAESSRIAADAQDDAAKGYQIAAGIKAATSIATLFI